MSFPHETVDRYVDCDCGFVNIVILICFIRTIIALCLYISKTVLFFYFFFLGGGGGLNPDPWEGS